SSSSLRPAGVINARLTQKSSERSMVLRSELVIYMRWPSPVTCIMLGCTPGLSVLCSFGFLRSLTSHCWISSDAKQLTKRYLSSGDWRRSAGGLAASPSLRGGGFSGFFPSPNPSGVLGGPFVEPAGAAPLVDQQP